MANEFKIKNGFFSEGSSNITGSFLVTDNVGIGTASPSTKLHVSINDNTFSGNTLLENTNSGSSAMSVVSFKTANNASQFTVGQVNNGGGAILYNAANTSMTFSTNTSARMIIAAGGNVGIGTSLPDASAILDLTSTTQGFLLPRMNAGDMNSISSPAEGLMIWETDSKSVSVYDGSSWRRLLFA